MSWGAECFVDIKDGGVKFPDDHLYQKSQVLDEVSDAVPVIVETATIITLFSFLNGYD